MESLEFCSPDVAKLLGSCLCLFDAINELHAMDGKMFNDFLIRRCTWILHVMKA